ncbi:hypothetical protein K8F61_08405 [Microbacterium resistens]|uniref:DUF5134 domain-containing protein n=1 Tax=Microbacterium resistens TaxID=156977 RepID=A0ABY3RXU9_9MICO|nr:hypothetical protein [Microbacterium resistens]UGS28165.1 hypothetical protein K8F61_08405 [Microbacterium resistens]
MQDPHAVAMALMSLTATVAAVCSLVAGPAVPWQGRQSAVVMAAGMIASAIAPTDPAVLLAVAAAGLLSALLGTVGLRGRRHAEACFHRALATLVMTACALAPLGRGAGPVAVHTHGGAAPVGVVVLAGVLVVLAGALHHVRGALAGDPSRRARWLLVAEGTGMAIATAIMGVMALSG